MYSMRIPFEDVRQDFAVIVSIMQGQRPSRDVDIHAGGEPIPDVLWDKMQTWWAQDPAHRPDAAHVAQELATLSS